MKQHYFIKFDRRINKIIGCQRATLILSTLEFWFSKKPEGFYKFIEPCSHPLYKKQDSWTEELGCDPKSFTNSFKKIGVKYKSRTAFEKAKDKFQGKMYASFYDRYSNRVFFIRNDEKVSEFFAGIHLPLKTDKSAVKTKENKPSKAGSNALENLLRNGKNSRSYKEPNNSSLDLSKDKSHAEEIIKKMIEIWTALVEEGKELVKLSKTTIPFLKKAFTDKFDNCLEKWKKYCYDIASSRFLMGEKTSWKAKLDWALIFKNIEKVLDGQYGIGDRRPSSVPSACESFIKNSKIEIASEKEIIEKSADEPELVREFRLKWLNKFGANNYREYLKDCAIDVESDATLHLRPSSRYNAKSIASYWTSTLLEESPFTLVNIIQQEGDLVFDKWFGLEPRREGRLPHNEVEEVRVSADLTTGEQIAPSLPESTNIIEDVNEKSSEEPRACESEESGAVVVQVTSETQMLRKKLRESMPNNHFPTWLGGIEVEEVGRDGAVIVAFEDSFAVGWSRSRFSKEIFQSAASLWKGVNKLIIRQKAGDTSPFPIEKLPKKSENVAEKSTLEQAIKSFLSVCSPGMKASETFGMQGTC